MKPKRLLWWSAGAVPLALLMVVFIAYYDVVLDEVAAAIGYLERGRARGKVIVTITAGPSPSS